MNYVTTFYCSKIKLIKITTHFNHHTSTRNLITEQIPWLNIPRSKNSLKSVNNRKNYQLESKWLAINLVNEHYNEHYNKHIK